MSELTRTKQGKFDIKNTKLVEDINDNDLIKIQDILDIKKVNIDDDLYFKIRNGQIIKNLYGKEEVMFLYKDCVVSIYRIYEKDNTLLKPYIMIERDL